MRKCISKLANTIASAGVACLLLGAFACGPSAKGLTAMTYGVFTSGTAMVSDTWLDHVSYGEWNFNTGGWITSNSQDLYGSGSVSWTVPSGHGWYVMVLYNYELGGNNQILYLYQVNVA